MKIDIVTLFPNMFNGPFEESIIKRAINKELVNINIYNLRNWAKNKHKIVDDKPYGGGTGMLLKIEPIYKAIKELKKGKTKVILLSPQGKVFNQKKAKKLSKESHLIFICGHYEGFDERIKKHLIDEEISIGDYVLTGGELPAMVVVDSVVRLIPGVLEKSEATKKESFSNPELLEYPQYTRPETFRGWSVPKVLLSGNRKKIEKWQEKQASSRTKKRRPELFKA